MPIMKILKYLTLAILFLSLNCKADLSKVFSPETLKDIKAFNTYCDHTYNPSKNKNTLLLIDATDPLNKDQIAYIRDNFINKLEWSNEGDKFTIVLLNDKSVMNSDYISICSPITESQITASMAKNKELAKIAYFKKIIGDAFDGLVQSKVKAGQSHIIEALVEIFRSKRYGFDNGDRHLIIASDLYQNSEYISFYNLCSSGQCPSLKETLKNKKIADFLNNEAKLNFDPKISAEIFQLKTQDKISLSVKPWWIDYLSSCGLPKEKIKISSQLN